MFYVPSKIRFWFSYTNLVHTHTHHLSRWPSGLRRWIQGLLFGALGRLNTFPLSILHSPKGGMGSNPICDTSHLFALFCYRGACLTEHARCGRGWWVLEGGAPWWPWKERSHFFFVGTRRKRKKHSLFSHPRHSHPRTHAHTQALHTHPHHILKQKNPSVSLSNRVPAKRPAPPHDLAHARPRKQLADEQRVHPGLA